MKAKMKEENDPPRFISIPDIYLASDLVMKEHGYEVVLQGDRVVFRFEITDKLMKDLAAFPKSPFYDFAATCKMLRGLIHATKQGVRNGT